MGRVMTELLAVQKRHRKSGRAEVSPSELKSNLRRSGIRMSLQKENAAK